MKITKCKITLNKEDEIVIFNSLIYSLQSQMIESNGLMLIADGRWNLHILRKIINNQDE